MLYKKTPTEVILQVLDYEVTPERLELSTH